MGAIVDRLNISLQDARQWLGVSLAYSMLTAVVYEPPEVDTDYFDIIGGKKYTFNSGATPTKETIVTGLLALIAADPPNVNFTATDLGGGKYKLEQATEPTIIEMFLSDNQYSLAESVDDVFLESLITVSKEYADEYCNNPFAEVDDCGEITELNEIPQAVKVGVLQILKWLYADSQDSGNSGGRLIQRQRAGDLSITYDGGSDNLATDLPTGIKAILGMYRLIPGSRYPQEDKVIGGLINDVYSSGCE